MTILDKPGIDLNVTVPIRNLAVQVLTCMELCRNLKRLSVQRDQEKTAETEQKQAYVNTAEEENAEAQVALGERYYQGNEVAQDYGKAFECFSIAADFGHPKALYWLVELYAGGLGVTKDIGKAGEFFLKAAEQGEHNAEAILGDWYLEGVGVPQDYEKAFHWLSKAAEAGNSIGLYVFGLLFLNEKFLKPRYRKSPAIFRAGIGKRELLGDHIFGGNLSV